MSYDVAVWAGPRPTSNDTALAEFLSRSAWLEEEELPPRVPASPPIAAFVAELLRTYPDLDDVADHDDSPWAVGRLANEAQGDFIYFAMTYPGARAALGFVAEAAHRHGLVCFDPQAQQLL